MIVNFLHDPNGPISEDRQKSLLADDGELVAEAAVRNSHANADSKRSVSRGDDRCALAHGASIVPYLF